MGFERSFTVGLLWRIVVLALVLWALGHSIVRADLVAVPIVAALLAIGAVASLWTYVRRTNVELARFVSAVSHGDLSQGFGGGRRGGGFETLGAELDAAMRKLREERATAVDAGRYQAALVDEAPVALLVVDAEGRVELANRAARRLFGALEAVRVADYAPAGDDLVAALNGATRRIAEIVVDEKPQRAMLLGGTIHRLGRPLRVVAVQPIQGELNMVELAAQADLVRVLTHEIMNSMTPVTSLAHTAAGMMAEMESADPAFDDARMAVETLARRAEGIMHFVEGYREFIRAPVIRPRSFAARPWAEELARLFAATEAGHAATLDIACAPEDVAIDADPDLLAQAVLNLLKNGAEAAIGAGAAPALRLSIARMAGERRSIMVSDNGPGIAPDRAGDIFLPFFTTKAKGTGIGLSLVRRIAVAHGGTIAALPHKGGACFEIVL